MINKLVRLLLWRSPSPSHLLKYWRWRSLRYGPRSAANLACPKEELQAFLDTQKKELLHLLDLHLKKDKIRLILDFGCGPGFFSTALAEHFQARVTAIDPTKSLLRKAPPHPRVSYLLYQPPHWPATAQNFDLIWIRHVLAGIPAAQLPALAQKLIQSLSPQGKLFLCEKTGPLTPEKGDYWFQRPASFYAELFQNIGLQPLKTQKELGEEVTLFLSE